MQKRAQQRILLPDMLPSQGASKPSVVCGALLEQYGVSQVSYLSWELSYLAEHAKRQYRALNCDQAMCEYLADTYGVVAGGREPSKWGVLPEALYQFWRWSRPATRDFKGGSCDKVLRK